MNKENLSAKQLIQEYKLQPHPEGGFYKVSFWDSEEIPEEALPSGYSGSRAYMNSIIYLIPKEEKCILHKIRMNEAWAFHMGGALELHQFFPDGNTELVVLGANLTHQEKVFHVVPKDCWMGALLSNAADDYCLVSCITAPGFTTDDWERGDRSRLMKKYPKHKRVIERLT